MSVAAHRTGSRPPEDGHGRRRTGRRPSPPRTRARIVTEARRLFATWGYERTTIRAVASAAHVDPALVHHYFGTKDGLLEAALTPPADMRTRISHVIGGGPGGLGERTTRAFLELWEDQTLGPAYLAIVRCAASHERAATMMRTVVDRQVLEPLVTSLGMPDAELRANLVASQFIGVAMTRYLTRLEPLATCDIDTVVAVVAPTIERYLIGPLQVPPQQRLAAGRHAGQGTGFQDTDGPAQGAPLDVE